MDFETCAAAMVKTYELSERLFDKIAWCRHATGEMYPPYLGLFVGDRSEDEQCAKLAGFDFKWAHEWRAEATVAV